MKEVYMIGWFSKWTGTSLHNGVRGTNTQIWSNKNRIQAIPRALKSSSDVLVLLLNRLINSYPLFSSKQQREITIFKALT